MTAILACAAGAGLWLAYQAAVSAVIERLEGIRAERRRTFRARLKRHVRGVL